MNLETIPALNIQSPWAFRIVSGVKSIETRGYPLPGKYQMTPMAVIETPGTQIFKARIVGLVVFKESFQYHNIEQWRSDAHLHLVDEVDPNFTFASTPQRWGWAIASAHIFSKAYPAPKNHGIRFLKACSIPVEAFRDAPELCRPSRWQEETNK